MRTTLAMLLLTTGLLKAFFIVDLSTNHGSYSILSWVTVFTVQVEFVIALLLLSGWRPDAAWLASLLLFVSFAAFSLSRAVAGYESCGCFGALQVHPWWTFTIDLIVIGLLWFRRREFLEPRPMRWRLSPPALAMSYVALIAISLAGMVRTTPATLGEDGLADGGSGVVFLEPSDWVGKKFPLTEHLAPRVDLSHGQWVVLLYHHDCTKCQEVLPAYERLAGEGARVLLVETSPAADSGGEELPDGHARLSAEREWFVQTPVEIQVSDGQVKLASLDLPSVERGAFPLLARQAE